jgi:hypothetical protein
MSLIIYPDENYNSWISEADAEDYFEMRLNTEPWDTADREAALITAFRSLAEFDLTIDPTEGDQLVALKNAQCEQALHELKNDTEGLGISGLSLGGMVSVKIPANQIPPPRYSERALAILRPNITARTVKRTR